MDPSLKTALAEHPCYDEAAHRTFARMHLPVAPRCNIQCNYCNRKYDCSNESRPGVTSEVLTPEQASDKVAFVYSQIPELKVIGIAGPGDPMANESTFATIDAVHRRFPELTMCVSTNGLALPGNAKRLYDLGVRFVTITMNAVDPAVGERIYSFVTKDGKPLKGREAAEYLIEQQKKGLDECVALGMVVKINIVMIPGINDGHIPELVRYVKSKGAYTVNILPLIPVEGTAFQDMEAPTPEMRKALMDQCGDLGIRVMRHCKQCRADAIGKLGDDRSAEFAGCGSCRTAEHRPILLGELRDVVAVATDDGVNVNRGFGNASEFRFYSLKDGKEVGKVSVDLSAGVAGKGHREHLQSVLVSLNAPKYIAVSEIGHYPEELIKGQGIRLLVTKERIEDLLARLG